MNSILEKIFELKRRRVADAKLVTRIDEMRERAKATREAKAIDHGLIGSLQSTSRLNVIAEFKKASPSKGVINQSSDPMDVARMYEAGGACAISVLTEEDHFLGSLDDLSAIRNVVDVPVLRKDFTFDEFQIHEAAAAGADAILLIVAALEPEDLARLRCVAEDELGLDALVEVHTSDEMKIASNIGARLIGVNNRDLRTFDVSLDISRSLIELAPAGAVLVAESGLRSGEDLRELRSVGYSGFLIGETLMRSEDMAASLRSLLGEPV